MDKKSVFSRLLPYLAAAALFGAVCAAYFAPQLSGKVLQTHDVTQYEGGSRDVREHYAEWGEDPQWTGAMFSGMPSQTIHFRHDSMILKRLSGALDFMGRPASLIFLAMAAFFVMLIMFGVDPWTGIIPSLAYGLSTYFFIIIGAGHITKMLALAWAPLMMGGVFYTYRRNMWLGAALTALFASLEIAANHPQITYYFTMALAAYWISELVAAIKGKALPRFAKATGLLAVAATLALGSNFSNLWYTMEYTPYSTRGGTELTVDPTTAGRQADKGLDLEYATAWSYGKMESFNMFIPDLVGGSSMGGFSDDGQVADALARYQARGLAGQLPPYWGDQPITAGPTYLGAAVIFLFVMGLFLVCGRNKWWVVIISAIALMLSWGSNFMWFTELFFYYLPGYNKFRTVAMILVILQWSVPFIAALMLAKLWKAPPAKERVAKAARNALYITGGVALFFLILGGSIFSFSSPTDSVIAAQGIPDDVIAAMRHERASMLRSDSLRSLIFVLLAALVMTLWSTGKLRKGWAVALLAVLVCADLIPVNLRYLPQSQFVEKRAAEMKPTAADLEILADTEPGFRVLNLTVSPFNDATTSNFHRSVGGYSGAKMQRYQDIVERHLSQMNPQVVNMLNTKYLIVPEDKTGRALVQLNPEANGAAWFVGHALTANGANEEIAALDTLDTKRWMVVDQRFARLLPSVTTTADSTSHITLAEYRPNYQKYEYSASDPTFAVFSEIYYDKGWTAWLDGEPAEYFRADYVLRGMVLPAGEHTVEFRFRAQNFGKVSAVTYAFSWLIILCVAGGAAYTVISNRKKKQDGTAGSQTQA